MRTAFPDLRFTIHDEIAEADKVVIRWTVTGTQHGEFFGHLASGRRIDVSGINIFRIAGGKIQEIWVNMDRAGRSGTTRLDVTPETLTAPAATAADHAGNPAFLTRS